jgi:hypothetical protein
MSETCQSSQPSSSTFQSRGSCLRMSSILVIGKSVREALSEGVEWMRSSTSFQLIVFEFTSPIEYMLWKGLRRQRLKIWEVQAGKGYGQCKGIRTPLAVPGGQTTHLPVSVDLAHRRSAKHLPTVIDIKPTLSPSRGGGQSQLIWLRRFSSSIFGLLRSGDLRLYSSLKVDCGRLTLQAQCSGLIDSSSELKRSGQPVRVDAHVNFSYPNHSGTIRTDMAPPGVETPLN